jgi:hypothetical protein
MVPTSLFDLPLARQRTPKPTILQIGDQFYVRRRTASVDRQNKFIVVRWRTRILPLPLNLQVSSEDDR